LASICERSGIAGGGVSLWVDSDNSFTPFLV
jgi:hypothetical protein